MCVAKSYCFLHNVAMLPCCCVCTVLYQTAMFALYQAVVFMLYRVVVFILPQMLVFVQVVVYNCILPGGCVHTLPGGSISLRHHQAGHIQPGAFTASGRRRALH